MTWRRERQQLQQHTRSSKGKRSSKLRQQGRIGSTSSSAEQSCATAVLLLCPTTCSSVLSLTPRASAWKQRAARSQLPLLHGPGGDRGQEGSGGD